MKLSHKIGKLFSREGHARGWRRFQRKLHPIPLQPLLDRIDQERVRDIQRRYANSPRQVSKYADVERWLKTNIERVQDLGLNRGRRLTGTRASSSPRQRNPDIRESRISSPVANETRDDASPASPSSARDLDRQPPDRADGLNILDLGCGGGFFLFICQQLGHRCLGLDLDEFPLYGELVDLLGVERRIWEIKTREPLPDLGRKFDWITAFSIGFNRHPDKTPWGQDEWDFFLTDLEKNHLKPGGKIYLALNPQLAGKYYTDELHKFFVRRGAKVQREQVLLKTKRRF